MTNLKKIGMGLGIFALYLSVMFGASLFSRYSLLQRTGKEASISNYIGAAYVHDSKGVRISKVKPGDEIEINFKYTKNDECEVDLSITMYGLDNHRQYFMAATTTWILVGTYEYDDILFIPPQFPPGKYHIKKKAVSRCSGVSYLTIPYDVPLEIVTQNQ